MGQMDKKETGATGSHSRLYILVGIAIAAAIVGTVVIRISTSWYVTFAPTFSKYMSGFYDAL